jgi:hypothetical protein
METSLTPIDTGQKSRYGKSDTYRIGVFPFRYRFGDSRAAGFSRPVFTGIEERWSLPFRDTVSDREELAF